MPKVLVTGGAGFIGSHLVKALRRRDIGVRVLDDLSTGRRGHLPSDVELVVGDVVDGESVRTSVAGVDVIFHLAAIASVEASAEDGRRAHAVNLGGALEVFRAAAGRKCRVIFASSAAIYGEADALPVDEMSPTAPLSQYGIDKLEGERQLRALAEASGLDWLAFRIFNVYGPGQNPSSPYSGVISIFLDRLRSGEPLCVFGTGEQCRDFVHIDDVIACLLWGTELPGRAAETYNICTGHGTSINQLARLVLELGGGSQAVTHGPPRHADIMKSIGANGKLARAGGPVPKTALPQGLRSLVNATIGAKKNRM